MNIFKIVVCVVFIFILYRYTRDPIIRFFSSKALPKEVTLYKSLSEVPVVFDGYEMVPLFIEKERPTIAILNDMLLYDSINKCNYITSIDNSQNLGSMNPHVYWKLDDRGDIVDSISVVDIRLFNCGVFFENDYYIDWFNTGDKTRKSFVQIMDDNDLTVDQIKAYIDEALVVDVGVDYTDHSNVKLELFLFNGTGWSVLKSKKLYNEIVPSQEENDYESKGSERLFEMRDIATFSIKLEKHLGDFKRRFSILKENEWPSQEKEYVMEVVAFEKQKRFKPPFFSNESLGYPGWYGTGFVRLTSASVSFPFKLEAFEHDRVETGISLYCPIVHPGEGFILVKIGAKRNREDLQDYYGLYILRRVMN